MLDTQTKKNEKTVYIQIMYTQADETVGRVSSHIKKNSPPLVQPGRHI